VYVVPEVRTCRVGTASVELLNVEAVAAPLIAAVPVTARALAPSVAPFRAKDVPVPAPIAVLVALHVVHAIISTISLRAAATLRTTVVPVVAV
jgi:hypothetical protein